MTEWSAAFQVAKYIQHSTNKPPQHSVDRKNLANMENLLVFACFCEGFIRISAGYSQISSDDKQYDQAL